MTAQTERLAPEVVLKHLPEIAGVWVMTTDARQIFIFLRRVRNATDGMAEEWVATAIRAENYFPRPAGVTRWNERLGEKRKLPVLNHRIHPSLQAVARQTELIRLCFQ